MTTFHANFKIHKYNKSDQMTLTLGKTWDLKQNIPYGCS